MATAPPELRVSLSAAASWLPGRADDGLILHGDSCARMALEERLCRLSRPSTGLLPAVNS